MILRGGLRHHSSPRRLNFTKARDEPFLHLEAMLNDDKMRVIAMRDSYDFSNSVKSPYTKRMKQQIATPHGYETTPATTFVAGFIGQPPMNLVPALLLPLPLAGDSVGEMRLQGLHDLSTGIQLRLAINGSPYQFDTQGRTLG